MNEVGTHDCIFFEAARIWILALPKFTTHYAFVGEHAANGDE